MICHPLSHNLEIWKLLVILVVIKLYARIDILKKSVLTLFQDNDCRIGTDFKNFAKQNVGTRFSNLKFTQLPISTFQLLMRESISKYEKLISQRNSNLIRNTVIIIIATTAIIIIIIIII